MISVLKQAWLILFSEGAFFFVGKVGEPFVHGVGERGGWRREVINMADAHYASGAAVRIRTVDVNIVRLGGDRYPVGNNRLAVAMRTFDSHKINPPTAYKLHR